MAKSRICPTIGSFGRTKPKRKAPRRPMTDRQVIKLLDRWLKKSHVRATGLPRVGYVQVGILLAVSELGAEAFGARIISWLCENRTLKKKALNEGQLYDALRKLVKSGLLSRSASQNPSGKGRSVVTYGYTRKTVAILKAILIWQREISSK